MTKTIVTIIAIAFLLLSVVVVKTVTAALRDIFNEEIECKAYQIHRAGMIQYFVLKFVISVCTIIFFAVCFYGIINGYPVK